MKNRVPAIFLGVLLLLTFWATRVLALDSFPPFIDEAYHVTMAERIVESGDPAILAGEGRIFSIWWYLLFQPYNTSGAIWLVRVVTALAMMPGLAALFATGRLAAGTWGGVLAGLVYLFSTYHLFFDRLALADSVANAAIAIGLYFAYRLSRRLNEWDAVLCGVTLFVASGAKIGALPYLGIPLAAVLTLGPRTYGWKRRARWLTIAAGIQFGLLGVLFAVTRWRNQDIFFQVRRTSSNSAQLFDLDRIQNNVDTLISIAESYWGLAALLVLGIGIVWLLIRKQFYLLLVFFAPTLMVMISLRQGTRYLIAPLTTLILAGAVGIALLIRSAGMLQKSLVLIATLAWGIWLWVPFASDLYRNPGDLALYTADRAEYVESDASGFGLAQVITVLEDQNPSRVIGLLANCAALRYTTLNDWPVECPHMNPTGADITTLEAEMAASRSVGTYVVLEDIPFAPESAPGKLLTVIEDDSGRPSFSIYDLAP